MTVSTASPPQASERLAAISIAEPGARRELTLRAVLAGCGIGAILAVGNVYMGLKTGWIDQGNITAAILGFALFAALRRLGGKAYEPLENNITQTVASSAAGMSFTAGLVGAFPALAMLGHRHPSWAISLWGVALGGLGILIAIPLRDQLIARDPLPFPSGIATAEVIEAMHTAGASALRKARALLASAAGAMGLAWFRDGRPAWIPQTTPFPIQLAGVSGETLTLGFNWSPLLLGTGALIGPRNGLSLLAGAVIGWGGLAPFSIGQGLVPRAEFSALSAWLLWPGVALMASAALTSLALDWKTFGRSFRDLAQLRSGTPRTRSAWVWGLPAAAIGLAVVLGKTVFGLHPLLTLVSLALSVVLASVCARATGETDIAPITQMGQLTQIFVGTIAPTQVATNVLAGSVVAADATQTSQTLWSLKTGHLLGANQRRQLLAQWIGVVAGALVVVPAYELVSRAYGLGTQALPAPTALSWKGLAELVHLGVAGLPPGARRFTLIAVVLGAALAVLDRSSRSPFVPSAVAMGVGFLAPASYAVTIATGSLILAAARAWKPAWVNGYAAPIASGTIAGESLLGVLIAILLGIGVLKPP